MNTSDSYQEIVAVAEQMLAGKISILEGSRHLVSLASQTELYEADGFQIFRSVDSEVDHLPIGQDRKYWNEDVLKIKDQEIKDYEASINDAALQACQELVSTYKTPS